MVRLELSKLLFGRYRSKGAGLCRALSACLLLVSFGAWSWVGIDSIKAIGGFSDDAHSEAVLVSERTIVIDVEQWLLDRGVPWSGFVVSDLTGASAPAVATLNENKITYEPNGKEQPDTISFVISKGELRYQVYIKISSAGPDISTLEFSRL